MRHCLRFPNRDVLQLAITSGVLPEAVIAAPVKCAVGPDGDIWLQPAEKLPRGVRAALERLGVEAPWITPLPLNETLVCWLQAFPLLADPSPLAAEDRLPVLFDLPQPEQLPELVAEILRLGNDRQSFCHVTSGDQVRTLLRVIGPPYYSLLRALERNSADRAGPCAYVERGPRVWVQIGYRHPLQERIVTPPGKWLILQAPHVWQTLDEMPFQDVYRAFECRVQHGEVVWTPAHLEQRITVPLRLTAGGSEDAEMWVLRDGGEAQLDALVSAADDQLLSRLAFAVGQCDGRRTIVLRVRPSKQAPPVVVLDAVAFRPYLKLPNLFLPCGLRLHPPLRRSTVAQILAPDANRITWLDPHDDGTFTPESLPDAAFRPLSDWVDYVFEREHQALNAWVEAHRFDFEAFVCPEDRRPREDRPKRTPEPAAPPADVPPPADAGPQPAKTEEWTLAELVPEPATPAPGQPPADAARDAVQRRLSELEQRFLSLDAPWDSEERTALWREMGAVNSWLGYHLDAAVCWSHAVWEQDGSLDAVREAWLESTRKACGLSLSNAEIDGLLAASDTLPDRAAAVAQYLICASRSEPAATDLAARLGPLARYLERYEGLLSFRVAWLAWVAIYRLSGGDVLALARARDRALERLYQYGLRTDVDVPSFLRGLGSGDSQQVRTLRERLQRVYELVAEWIEEPPTQPHPRTRQYAGLMFAYAMARIGETTGCQTLLEQARVALGMQDPVHRWAWEAFQFRIRQALSGQSARGRLADELLQRLEGMEPLERYKVDRLRQNSRILEPSEQVDPYRNWRHHVDDFTRAVTTLADIHDRGELQARIQQLFGQTRSGTEPVAREALLLGTALELAPRLGESFSRELLERVAPLLGHDLDAAAAQRVLEKALFLAAHFDQRDYLDVLLARIYDLLERQQPDQAGASLGRMLSECFRGLRKLGLRDEVGRLLSRISAVITNPPPKPRRSRQQQESPATEPSPIAALRLRLLVASGWLFFGQQHETLGILDEARNMLFQGELKPAERTELAQGYVTALGYAPADFALPRIEELFAPAPPAPGSKRQYKLVRVRDNLTTTSHFALFQLRIVEAVVLALVSEEFAMNAEGRRWLDEDEFQLRRRLHQDVRLAMEGPSKPEEAEQHTLIFHPNLSP